MITMLTPEERKIIYKKAALLRWENRRKKGNMKRSAEHTAKIVAKTTGKKRSPEVVEKMRQAALLSWRNRNN